VRLRLHASNSDEVQAYLVSTFAGPLASYGLRVNAFRQWLSQEALSSGQLFPEKLFPLPKGKTES
jgi:hypothetical protein